MRYVRAQGLGCQRGSAVLFGIDSASLFCQSFIRSWRGAACSRCGKRCPGSAGSDFSLFWLGNEVHAGRSTEACSIHGVQQTAAGTAMCEHSSRQSFAQVGPRSDQACIGFWRSGPAQRRGNFAAAGWLHRTWDRCFFLSKADPACLPSRSVVKVGRSRVRQGVVEALPVAGLAARHVQLHRVDKSRAQCRVYAQLIFLHLTQRLFSVS